MSFNITIAWDSISTNIIKLSIGLNIIPFKGYENDYALEWCI